MYSLEECYKIYKTLMNDGSTGTASSGGTVSMSTKFALNPAIIKRMPGINCIKPHNNSFIEKLSFPSSTTSAKQKFTRAKFQRPLYFNKSIVSANVITDQPEDSLIAEEFGAGEEPIHKDLARRETEKAYKVSRLTNGPDTSPNKTIDNVRDRSISTSFHIPNVTRNRTFFPPKAVINLGPEKMKTSPSKYNSFIVSSSSNNVSNSEISVANSGARVYNNADGSGNVKKSDTVNKALRAEKDSSAKVYYAIGKSPKYYCNPLTKNESKLKQKLAALVNTRIFTQKEVSRQGYTESNVDELNEIAECAEDALRDNLSLSAMSQDRMSAKQP